MGIIKNYHDKKWTLQFLDALYNSIDLELLKTVSTQINHFEVIIRVPHNIFIDTTK
jgi:hypothetical protein